jgi:glycosyltransferase involved in cell wall biosynthesis
MRAPAALLFRLCEAACTLAFDRVIAVTPSIASAFPPRKTRLVQNFPWRDEFRRAGEVPYEKRDPIAVYVGGLSDQRGLREMRQAVELAAKQVPIRLVIAGKLIPGARAEFQRDSASRLVEYKGMLDRSQVADLLGRARVGLAVFHPTANYLNSQPHKLFEYMAAKLPVVASDFPHWRRMIGSPACGLLVDSLNPAAIAEALVWLFRHPARAAEMGQNGRSAVERNYNWEHESESLIATYAELLPAAASGEYQWS